MYYNKEELERLGKRGEERLIKEEKLKKGLKYNSAIDKEITCMHCKHDQFQKGNALLNTRGATFFDLDWLNESATTLICAKCGCIHWFGKEVKQRD